MGSCDEKRRNVTEASLLRRKRSATTAQDVLFYLSGHKTAYPACCIEYTCWNSSLRERKGRASVTESCDEKRRTSSHVPKRYRLRNREREEGGHREMERLEGSPTQKAFHFPPLRKIKHKVGVDWSHDSAFNSFRARRTIEVLHLIPCTQERRKTHQGHLSQGPEVQQPLHLRRRDAVGQQLVQFTS